MDTNGGRTHSKQSTAAVPCTFCDEFSGAPSLFEALAAESNFPYLTREIGNSENFVGIPGLGPITEGYLLVLPKGHYPAVGALPPKLFEEFLEFEETMLRRLDGAFGTTVAFEHGPANLALKAGCCVDHAHVHLLAPCEVDLYGLLAPYLQLVQVSQRHVLRELHSNELPYLWLRLEDQRMFVAIPPKSLPSQFIRRIIAKELGCVEWDWRSHPRFERVAWIYEELRSQ